MKKGLKKGLSVTLAAAMILSLSACSGGSNASPSKDASQTAPDEKRELRVTSMATWLGKYDFDAAKADFEKKHPGVTVTYNKVDTADVTTNMLQWSQGKTSCDLAIGGSREHAVQYAARDYIIKFDDDFFTDDFSKDKFFPAFLELGNIEGTQYMIPMLGEVMFIVVNKDLMKKAGLADANGNIPPAKDWNELYEYAKKATIKENGRTTQTGLSIDWGVSFMTYSYLAALQGIKGNFYESDKKTIDFTSAESKGLLESWVKLVKDGYTPTDTFADDNAGRTNFKAGNVAMLMTSASRWIECGQDLGAENVGIIPIPGTDKNGSLVYIHGVVIPKVSPNIDLAKAFIKEELLSKTFQSGGLDKYGKMDPIISHYGDKMDNADWQTVVNATEKAATPPLYKDFSKLDLTIQTELQKCIKGDQPVDTTQQNLSKTINSLDLTTGLNN